jgi:hypothetical protein
LARVFVLAGRSGAGAAALASLATAQWPLGVLTTAHVEAVRLACAGGGGAAVDAMLAAPLTAHARDMRLGAGDAFAALAGAGALACGASPPRWAAAAAAYRTCLVLPAASVGEEHAAAVRKLLLAEVLARGPRAALDVPAATAPILAGALDAAAGVKALAAAVARGARRAALDAIVCEHAAALEKEPALVAAVLAHAPRVRLLRLQAVYDRLPLAGPRGAAARADVPEADAAALLRDMVRAPGGGRAAAARAVAPGVARHRSPRARRPPLPHPSPRRSPTAACRRRWGPTPPTPPPACSSSLPSARRRPRPTPWRRSTASSRPWRA